MGRFGRAWLSCAASIGVRGQGPRESFRSAGVWGPQAPNKTPLFLEGSQGLVTPVRRAGFRAAALNLMPMRAWPSHAMPLHHAVVRRSRMEKLTW